MLQWVAVCCSVLRCVAVWYSLICRHKEDFLGVAACCSVLQRVAVCCSVLQCGIVLHADTKRPFWELQRVAARCSVLQCVTVWYGLICKYIKSLYRDTLLHTAIPHCTNTATHCNTLQHTAIHCNTLQHATTHYPSTDRLCLSLYVYISKYPHIHVPMCIYLHVTPSQMKIHL